MGEPPIAPKGQGRKRKWREGQMWREGRRGVEGRGPAKNAGSARFAPASPMALLALLLAWHPAKRAADQFCSIRPLAVGSLPLPPLASLATCHYIATGRRPPPPTAPPVPPVSASPRHGAVYAVVGCQCRTAQRRSVGGGGGGMHNAQGVRGTGHGQWALRSDGSNFGRSRSRRCATARCLAAGRHGMAGRAGADLDVAPRRTRWPLGAHSQAGDGHIRLQPHHSSVRKIASVVSGRTHAQLGKRQGGGGAGRLCGNTECRACRARKRSDGRAAAPVSDALEAQAQVPWAPVEAPSSETRMPVLAGAGTSTPTGAATGRARSGWAR